MSLVDRGKIYGGAFDGDFRPAVRRDKNEMYVFDAFKSLPLYVDDDGDGAPTGSAGDVNIMRTDRNSFEYSAKGTQSAVVLSWDANGLNVTGDATADDGWELTQGITARSRGYFTVGTDESFFFALTFAIEDVSGTDDCFVGFRKAEAYQANLDDYDEMAGLNVISGNITIETILNGGTTTSTDTTDDWTEGATTKTLGVYVASDGAVTYKIDGADPSTTASYTFDDGEYVVPCFFFLHAADLAGYMRLTQWECGFSSAILYP